MFGLVALVAVVFELFWQGVKVTFWLFVGLCAAIGWTAGALLNLEVTRPGSHRAPGRARWRS